jgi:L-asparaginase/Glu-tRNA(Gln) amidotransferase subunit D
LPLVSAGDLTTEKAWVLLSAVLGESVEPVTARQLFSEVLAASS